MSSMYANMITGQRNPELHPSAEKKSLTDALAEAVAVLRVASGDISSLSDELVGSRPEEASDRIGNMPTGPGVVDKIAAATRAINEISASIHGDISRIRARL
jgi:hypothetical protein